MLEPNRHPGRKVAHPGKVAHARNIVAPFNLGDDHFKVVSNRPGAAGV